MNYDFSIVAMAPIHIPSMYFLSFGCCKENHSFKEPFSPHTHTHNGWCFIRNFTNGQQLFSMHFDFPLFATGIASVETTNISTGGENTSTYEHTIWCDVVVVVFVMVVFVSFVEAILVMAWNMLLKSWNIFELFLLLCVFSSWPQLPEPCSPQSSVWSFGYKTLTRTVHIVFSGKLTGNFTPGKNLSYCTKTEKSENQDQKNKNNNQKKMPCLSLRTLF